MQITDVRVRKIDKEGRLKGMASVTFDDLFVVHDIKIVDGEHGLFIAMPSRRSKEGGYRDIAHPINPEMRQKLQDVILDEFFKLGGEQTGDDMPDSL
ncbi:MAG TPA: septation regulator SpoVG [Candidatus Avilachnospira avistercoris]|nr:septation regulator SpoVG [Candidatus Avilachnospira avistercoris]